MKKIILLFVFGLLISNMTSAQTFTGIATDAFNDGSNPNLLDGISLEYHYDAASDTLSFRANVINLSSNSSAFGVNVMVNIPGGGSTFNFWGTNNMNPFHRLLTVWVTGTAPSNYTGTIGISDASGVSAQNYTSLSSNNIAISAVGNNIVLKLKRSDLIPDTYFSGNTITCGVAGAVGSNTAWNDDIYSPSGSMTITKNFASSTKDVQAKTGFDFSVYPNPAWDVVNISLDKELKGAHAILYNSFGQRVLSQEFSGAKHQLNIAALTKGVYWLSLEKDSEILTKKVVLK